MRLPGAPIERTGEGDFRVRLGDDERNLLRRLVHELEEVLLERPEDASLRRLRPPAYENDADGEREFRSLMAADLEAGRLENLRVLADTADRERLDQPELDRWLAALNDLRLVLGTWLDVEEETFAAFDPSAPNAYELAVYAFLTWLQEAAVHAASEAIG